MKDLQKEREDLKNKYTRMMEAHVSKGHVVNEGSHLDSAKEIKALYEELYLVSLELGDPIPVWF